MLRAREVTITSVIATSVPVPATRVVVATDGTPDADGAVRVGVALAHRGNVGVELYSVVEPLQLADPDGMLDPSIADLMTLSCESREAALLAQRDRTHPGIHDWPFTVDIGPRVDAIVERASRTGASLILVGLGEHGVAARLRQRETALKVARTATMPVLALPSVAWGVPHSALAAIDFTASSELAARAALDLLEPGGTLYLGHVYPRVPVPQGDSRSWEEIATSAVLPRLQEVARRLAPHPGVTVRFAVLHGEPASELLAFAAEYRVDLVAAGAHGRNALERLVLGSVSTTLIRTAECWVLVAPPMPERVDTDANAAPNDPP